MDELTKTINTEWKKRYGGSDVTDINALTNRVKLIVDDRDCWVANAKANQKEYLRLMDDASIDKDKIKKAIGNILSSIMKNDDAPASSELHIYTAIYQLKLMLDTYEPFNEEAKQLINEVDNIMEHYNV